MPLVDANEIPKYDLSNENDELIVYVPNEWSTPYIIMISERVVTNELLAISYKQSVL